MNINHKSSVQDQVKDSASDIEEIEKLEKLIMSSLLEIEELQKDLKTLEKELNAFLDNYYGSGAIFFKNNSESNSSANDNNLDKAKQEIYSRIAKVCSQEMLAFSAENAHEELLKIEGYLVDGNSQSASPQDLLDNLTNEYHILIEQMQNLKHKKQSLLESPAYELKQEIMWANVRTTETISRIKEDITSQVNRPN